MADRKPRSRAPLPPESRALSTTARDPHQRVLDKHGFNPDDFEWRPVPRRPRRDGWTAEVQRKFIDALADTGLVEEAARMVDMSKESAYRLRRAPGSEGFARAWDAALAAAAQQLIDIAFARVIEGEYIPVFDRDGCRIGGKRRYSERMTMFLMRAYLPDRFRHAHESLRQPSEPPAPALPSVPEALVALSPEVPVDPHRLMAPDRLDAAVASAIEVARVHELYPRDDRERYRHPVYEPDDMRATARSNARHRKAMGLPPEAEAAGEAEDDDP